MSESYKRLRRFTEIRSANYRSRPGTIETVHEYIGPDAVAHDLTEHDLEQLLAEHSAALAELERLRAERGQLAQAFANGWFEATAAVRMPGTSEREAAWKAYRDALETGAAPQQLESGGGASCVCGGKPSGPWPCPEHDVDADEVSAK